MTLEEAIKHAEEVAEEQEKMAKEWHENQVRKCETIRFAEMDYTNENECKKCADEHRQLAEWLKELKNYRKENDWTPIYEDLPEDLLPVNVTWTNRNPETYYENIKGKRFVDTAVYYQGDWYWWNSRCVDYLKEYGDRAPVERIDAAIEIIAWKPLPEPWEGEKE